MNLFKGIKNTYKKSEAAVLVQNLLEMQAKVGIFNEDPASSATLLVDAVWMKTPHLFDGRFGQRPHKLSLAAASFSNAIQGLKIGSSNSNVFVVCLGNVLNEVEVNGRLYPLNSLDMEILEGAMSVMIEASEAFEQSPMGQEMSKFFKDSE